MRNTPAPLLALGSIVAVQIGAATSTHMFDSIGPAGTAWLRLCWASLFFLILVRPRPWTRSRADLGAALTLGTASAVMTVAGFEAIARIPLGTEVAIAFLGPLGVAVLRRRDRWGLLWPVLAFVGVVLATRPWQGRLDTLGLVYALICAAGWAGYVILTQRIGDRFSGLDGLAYSIPVATVASAFVGVPQVAGGEVTPPLVLEGAALALLIPILPYTLELFALRRLTAAAFGTLMSLEPAAALLAGLVFLHQVPGAAQILGMLLVTAAALGTARSAGARRAAEPTAEGRAEPPATVRAQ
ncbi:EamA family transporter [Embleya sp. MST-111070]|uniref:EamA family transporter n=1 Tax=Embleya sp. MST-111070 TaxID=3398231 RepID=UPI003F7331B1